MARRSRRCVFPFASRKDLTSTASGVLFCCSRHCGLRCSRRQSGPETPECLPDPAAIARFRKLRGLRRTSPQGGMALPDVPHESSEPCALPSRACCAVGARLTERLEAHRPAILWVEILPERKNTAHCRRRHAPGRAGPGCLRGSFARPVEEFLAGILSRKAASDSIVG